MIVALALAAARARAIEVTPIAGIQALGGAHFFRGERGGVSGNADAVFAPALRVNESWSVLPSARSVYEGTRRVYDVLSSASTLRK